MRVMCLQPTVTTEMDVQEPTFKVFSGSDLVFSFEQPASDTSSHSGSASSLVQTLKLAKTHVNQCLTDLVRNSAGKEGNKDGLYTLCRMYLNLS